MLDNRIMNLQQAPIGDPTTRYRPACRPRRLRSVGILSVTIVCVMLAGCPGPTSDSPSPQASETATAPSASTPSRTPRKPVTLRILVVNDPGLTTGIDRLRGEWMESADTELTTSDITWPELVERDDIDADLIVYPARYLGALAQRDYVRPVRQGVLRGDDFDELDVFPAVRHALATYDNQVMGLPLGVEVALLAWRPQLLAEYQVKPPSTWREFDAIALEKNALLSERSDATTPAPLENWYAYMLIARAAAYTQRSGQRGFLFDARTMDPKIDTPPFKRALKEMAAIAERTTDLTAVLAGDTGVGVGLPRSAARYVHERGRPPGDLAWSALPGARETYRSSLQEWETVRGDLHRPILVGIGSRLASVTSASRNAAGAFRLLGWLSSSEVSMQLGPSSPATGPFRHSQLASAQSWLGAQWGRTPANALARAVQQSLSEPHVVVVPRIPQIDAYLSVLDESAQLAIRQELGTPEALAQAASRWQGLTHQIGPEKLRNAYRQHLNLAD